MFLLSFPFAEGRSFHNFSDTVKVASPSDLPFLHYFCCSSYHYVKSSSFVTCLLFVVCLLPVSEVILSALITIYQSDWTVPGTQYETSNALVNGRRNRGFMKLFMNLMRRFSWFFLLIISSILPPSSRAAEGRCFQVMRLRKASAPHLWFSQQVCFSQPSSLLPSCLAPSSFLHLSSASPTPSTAQPLPELS